MPPKPHENISLVILRINCGFSELNFNNLWEDTKNDLMKVENLVGLRGSSRSEGQYEPWLDTYMDTSVGMKYWRPDAKQIWDFTESTGRESVRAFLRSFITYVSGGMRNNPNVCSHLKFHDEPSRVRADKENDLPITPAIESRDQEFITTENYVVIDSLNETNHHTKDYTNNYSDVSTELNPVNYTQDYAEAYILDDIQEYIESESIGHAEWYTRGHTTDIIEHCPEDLPINFQTSNSTPVCIDPINLRSSNPTLACINPTDLYIKLPNELG